MRQVYLSGTAEQRHRCRVMIASALQTFQSKRPADAEVARAAACLQQPRAVLLPVAEQQPCVVCLCLDRPRTHVVLPCGHKCVCSNCAEQLHCEEETDGWTRAGAKSSCPVCRGPVKNMLRVWE